MINKEFKDCKELTEYYLLVKKLQEDHHGKLYTLVHDEIISLLNNCDSYTEFGVAQGGSLAIPCLLHIPKIRGYEIDLRHYNKARDYFEYHVKTRELDFKVINADTATCSIIDPVDLLYIDSFHYAKHLKKELNRHSEQVYKYIIMHDTNLTRLYYAIPEFLKENKNWEIRTKCTISVGFITIERIK